MVEFREVKSPQLLNKLFPVSSLLPIVFISLSAVTLSLLSLMFGPSLKISKILPSPFLLSPQPSSSLQQQQQQQQQLLSSFPPPTERPNREKEEENRIREDEIKIKIKIKIMIMIKEDRIMIMMREERILLVC